MPLPTPHSQPRSRRHLTHARMRSPALTPRACSHACVSPTVSRKLPGGLPLKSIKLIACQLFKVEPTKMQLLYTPPGQEKDIPEELDDDAKSLADLGVLSGGTIVIDETN